MFPPHRVHPLLLRLRRARKSDLILALNRRGDVVLSRESDRLLGSGIRWGGRGHVDDRGRHVENQSPKRGGVIVPGIASYFRSEIKMKCSVPLLFSPL